MLIGLLAAEGFVRLFDPDWRFIRRLLYFQRVDVANHRADPDPRILYRLRPGDYDYGDYSVHVNRMGYRGPERGKNTPPGVFRILCVGASNVYGASLSDEEAWPARLEVQLNRDCPGRFEVWNLGTSAYVGSQMILIAKEAIENYGPDLIILALSNAGGRAFLWGHPVAPYFNDNPRFWEVLLTPERLQFPSFLSYESRLWLIRNARLYRLGYFAVQAARGDLRNWRDWNHEDGNIREVRRFLTDPSREAAVAVFLCPSPLCHPLSISAYTDGIDVPLLDLKADHLPPEYLDIHPPAHVMGWYAEEIASWLEENELVP